MIKCPNCGRENADNFNFCLDCGYDLKAYREAFPDGVPQAPPPLQPANTATNMHAPSMEEISQPFGNPVPPSPPIALPHAMTPQASMSPLPPPPRQPTRPQVMLPEASPPTFPPMPMAQPPPTQHAPLAMPPSPMQAMQQASMALTPSPVAPSIKHEPQPMAHAPHATEPPPMAPHLTPQLGPQPMLAPMPTAPPPAMNTGPQPMPPPQSAPQQPSVPLPRSPTPMPLQAPLQAPPMATQPPVGTSECSSCGYANAATVKFCGNCGKRLDGAAAPAAAGGNGEGQGRTMFMHAADLSQTAKDKLCKLITIDQTGREGMTFTIKSGETLCGRVNGIILFFDDPHVSPTHCKFSFLQAKLKVIDQGSLNGVYLRIKQERRLSDGDLLRVGRQLFRYESLNNAAFQVKKQDGDDSRIWGSPNPGAFGRLVQILDDGRTGEIRLLSGERCQLGREIGDIVMPTDGFISGRHCVFAQVNGETVLTDLGSSNGTYVRVRGEADVGHGDFVLVGNQMLRVEII